MLYLQNEYEFVLHVERYYETLAVIYYKRIENLYREIT